MKFLDAVGEKYNIRAALEGPKLSPEQLAEAKKEMIKTGHPVRFLHNGQALNITTGDLASKGSNVMYHPVYWNFTKDTAKKIAKWLGVKPAFDQE